MKFIAGITTLLILGVTSIYADAPAWKKDLSSPKPGNHPQLPACKLNFELSWKGVLRSGTLEIDFGQIGAHKPDIQVIQFSAQSHGIASEIFPYTGSSWAELNPYNMRPSLFTAWERKKDETIKTRSLFRQDGVHCREESRENGKLKPKVKTHSFNHHPCFDIGSALLHIRSQKLDKNDTISLLIHPFNNPYILHVKVIGREIHEGRKSIHLNVSMNKIDKKTLKLKAYKKLKKPASLWLSDDNDRIPLELRADVFIGDVRATLTGFKKT